MASAQADTTTNATNSATSATGPIRLRQPEQGSTADQLETRPAQRMPSLANGTAQVAPAAAYVPGEFERFVQGQVERTTEIRRLGAELVTDTADGTSATDLSPLVPPDYLIAAGDEVLLTVWGTVDADLRLTVDRAGRITVPRVGTVQVGGLRYSELADVINRRIGQVFRNFQSSVALGRLRGIRVFVTGFVVKPGAYTVTSLSTVVAALMRAGGPSAAGSFRSIELRRGSSVVSRFDLYDLLLRGDRSADQIVQAGDVVHVGAVGPQIGFIGSVNKPAVLELKAGEGVAEALRMVGGLTAVADRSRLALERLQERDGSRIVQLQLPRDEKLSLSQGDVLRAFSAVSATLSIQKQRKRVLVEGEVQRPAEYVLPEDSSLHDAIRMAGGYASGAYIFATEFTRVSVQRTQQENYNRALRDLETDLARASGSQRVASANESSFVQSREASTNRLLESLRSLRPSGRIVLQLDPNTADLPDLALEDGDRIYIPARPTTVGVFGSVFNAASYLHMAGRSVEDYLKLAGGPTKGADEASIFLIRANGNVISRRQRGGWFSSSGDLQQVRAEPGDTVFVPEEMNKTTFTQYLKDWTQILSQFGLGVAAINVLTK